MSKLIEYINNYQNIKMLIIGDIMLDKFIYGKVERISPEAPVPVIRLKSEKMMLGGAGNVALNASELKVQTSFIGIIGKDNEGEITERLFKESPVSSHLFKLKDYPTIVKTRFIAGNSQLLRADIEEKFPDVSNIIDRLERIFVKFLKKTDVILLSDYNKGTLTKEVCQMIIKNANKVGKKVIVDPKGNDYTKYEGAFLVKPNLKEFSEAIGIKFDRDSKTFIEDIKEASTVFFDKYKVENLVITLSENGMAYASSKSKNEFMHIPTVAKEVYDVSGAGDTSLAILGASFAVNASAKDALTLANIGSGIAVGKLGTAVVTPNELKEEIKSLNTKDNISDKKILTLKEALPLIEKLKEKQKIIGFTNGCFDCLHLGHLNSFELAKKECDVLFVGINSDASVKRLKGETRPLQDELTRSKLISSLTMVDYVIIFDEDTAIPLVEALKPDVIAKEGYQIENWPEAQLVIKQGGRAVTLPRLEGYSTTSMLNKLKG